MRDSPDDVDIMAIGPHPDDVEFGCGGLLALAHKLEYTTCIIDVTKGELSTNGTVDERQTEAARAAEILGVSVRENLGLPNNFLFNSRETQDVFIRTIRKHKPRMILIPHEFDRHPDHENTPKLVREAVFTAGLRKYETGQERHRPTHILYYEMWQEFEPSFILDISDVWETKMKALLAHESQFSTRPDTVQTVDTSDSVKKMWEARARRNGFLINRTFGEAYRSVYSPIGLADPFQFLPNLF